MQPGMLTNALSMYENSMRKVTTADYIKDNFKKVIVTSLVLVLFIIVILILLRKSRIAEAKAKEAICVSKIEQMPAGSYDLILMDIQMPNMDGYKATETIRGLRDKEKAGIPIVAMTANAFEEDRREAFARGMNDHIAKPIDVEKVEEILISVLSMEKEDR